MVGVAIRAAAIKGFGGDRDTGGRFHRWGSRYGLRRAGVPPMGVAMSDAARTGVPLSDAAEVRFNWKKHACVTAREVPLWTVLGSRLTLFLGLGLLSFEALQLDPRSRTLLSS